MILLDKLNKIDNCVARAEYYILMILMGLLTLILVSQVILRYFFASPIFWAEDVAVQILGLATCVGISYLIYSREMIKVDFILSFLKDKYLNILNKIIYLMSFVVMCIVCFSATEWIFLPENQLVISPTTGLLKFYNYLLMVISFYLMAWHLLIKLLKNN